MIARYTRPAMAAIWSEQRKYENWLRVEIAATTALARAGIVPLSAVESLQQRASFTIERIHEIEAETRHDVLAFTTAVAESVGEDSRWLHYGLTSTDVVDTAQGLALVQASALIREGIVRFRDVLRKRAVEFQHTPTIGRTHGVHAEPTTFGMKLLLWYAEMGRNLKRFDAAAEDLRVGKISGAVGAFGKLKPSHEAAILAELGLQPALISTQVLQRDRHAAYIATLAVLASTLDKIALEIRHLQRTEVREAEEFFSVGQKGSSAMPHKRNPITSENICGLARVVRGNAQVALENVALWHERDISHSSAERVILPDTTILADYLLDRAATLIERLLVYPARMLKNLESTNGLVFSGQLLIDLAAAGMSREDAYRLVQGHAMNAWTNDLNFRALIESDPEINQRMSLENIAAAFDVRRQLTNIDEVFARVLAEG
ncbi:adenylosuccinate lyase [Granulicella sp. L46]|jgi:adenylosuccinate lyase|uniref:adenylosuccinate lyase n=1 Tax=Granulicella sp. L46 TaxID=1641865 RepID=UPI00131A695A|nr:adenylosuccinate lyase [Granulicella sp. L46]